RQVFRPRVFRLRDQYQLGLERRADLIPTRCAASSWRRDQYSAASEFSFRQVRGRPIVAYLPARVNRRGLRLRATRRDDRQERGERKSLLSPEENELLTRTGPGTAMGEAMRRY